MQIARSTNQEIKEFIAHHSFWSVVNEKLHREYTFTDFVQAFGFMTEVAMVAERANHHPEWFNVYNKVIVDLTTHEVAGTTRRDFDLASKMDEIASHLLNK